MMTPLLPMHSLGHTFVPPPIHAGGLRYHGMAPLVSHVLRRPDRGEACRRWSATKAAVLWARTEGFIPAPETVARHRQAIREAKQGQGRGQGEGDPDELVRPRADGPERLLSQ
jgi:tryptophan synthase beta chain